jgi:hypothetical protein
MTDGIPDLFVRIAARMGEEYGCPIPQRTLSLGCGDGPGWGILMNPTKEKRADVPPFTAIVFRNGFPAGIVNLAGGTVVASGEVGDAEQELLEWVKTARKPEVELDQRNILSA